LCSFISKCVHAVTISANSWSDAGHAVNQIYNILHMMDRDDVSVGIGREGGVLDDGTFLPNVGGYLSLIEQVVNTLYPLVLSISKQYKIHSEPSPNNSSYWNLTVLDMVLEPLPNKRLRF
ncbi:Nucleoside hydrolase 5, partial [Linum perenne]